MEVTQYPPETQQFYTDGSARNDLVGVGVWCRNGSRSECIGTTRDLNVYFAELFAIWRIVQAIHHRANSKQDLQAKHFVIRSDSQAALHSLGKPRQQSGQHIISSILESVHQLKARRIRITFCWVLAHAGVEGNEFAH